MGCVAEARSTQDQPTKKLYLAVGWGDKITHLGQLAPLPPPPHTHNTSMNERDPAGTACIPSSPHPTPTHPHPPINEWKRRDFQIQKDSLFACVTQARIAHHLYIRALEISRKKTIDPTETACNPPITEWKKSDLYIWMNKSFLLTKQ